MILLYAPTDEWMIDEADQECGAASDSVKQESLGDHMYDEWSVSR